jgi:hypothetical protein
MVIGVSGLNGITASLTAELEPNVDPEPAEDQSMVEETAKEMTLKKRTPMHQEGCQVD